MDADARLDPRAAKVTTDDPRYEDLVRRGINRRFPGRPQYVRLVGSTSDVVDAVQEAVDGGLRLVARSGGHCLEGFVGDPAVQVVIDTSLMTAVYEDHGSLVVEAGAKLGEAYRKLFLGWGVALPAGVSPDVGVGGHVLGGAFGFLCRQHGLAADRLYGVEVVGVDGQGTARSVVATREPFDPNRELWWAHTGGGGGNFGIVTRYLFRSLPSAPASIRVLRASWELKSLDRERFVRLLQGFGAWCAANAEPGAPGAQLFSQIYVPRGGQTIDLKAVSTAGDASERLFALHLAAIAEGVGAPEVRTTETSSWLAFALDPLPEVLRGGAQPMPFKVKDAFFRRPLTERQADVVWRYVTGPEHGAVGGLFCLTTYGGQVNAVAADATASPHRDAILTGAVNTGWGRPEDEAPSLAWVRAFYRDLFADTGGVPIPCEQTAGAMINHPDTDLADPAWNTSAVPWHALYYGDNYPRLQRAKAQWDPRDVFRHALSIRLPGDRNGEASP